MQRLLPFLVAISVLLMVTITGCDKSSSLTQENENSGPAPQQGLVDEQVGVTNSGSGTVSPDNPKVTYTAGPFITPNITPATGLMCGTGTPCSDFNLRVETPPGFGSDNQMQIQVEWPNSTADFDLYILDEDGETIATAASSADPETVMLPPITGDYTVRVVPFAPLGESFTGTISFNQEEPNPAPSTAEPPTYTNYVAPERLPDRGNAGEPSIGINWNTGSVMYQASLSTYRVKFDDRTNPATANWTDVSANLQECTGGTVNTLDPILFTDNETGRTFQSQLAANPILNSFSCVTDNDGDSWTPSQGGGFASGVDHQTVGGGPFAERGVGPVTQYPNIWYYCSQDVATALCSVSRDGGITFGPAVPIYTLQECAGLHGQVKVGPQGAAYVPNGRCNGNQAVVVSVDNGTNWTVRRNPNSSQDLGSDPGVDIGANGTVYLGYQNGDGQPRAAVSLDRGQTWNFDQDVGAQVGVENIVFPKVIAGDDDRAAFTFIGTTTGGDYEAADFDGVWSIYVSTTYDGGESWVTVNATPNDPVQRGSICTGGTTCGNDRNLLDFIGIDVDKKGRAHVGWADGCVGDCVAGPPNSFTDVGVITRQSSGHGLFSEFDPEPQADLTASNVSAQDANGGKDGKDPKHKKDTRVSATVGNQGEASADNVVVKFLDGAEEIGRTTVDLSAGSSREVSIIWDEDKEKGEHRITVVADANDAISETDESNNKATETVNFK